MNAPERIHERVALLGRILIPEGGSLPYDSTDVDLQGFVDQFWNTNATNRLGLRVALWVVWWLGPLLALRRPMPLGSVKPAQQARVLRSLQHSKIYALRGMFLIVQTVVQMAFYSDNTVIEHLGYYNHLTGNKAEGYPKARNES